MSLNWYPIINYENCTECGSCFNKCTHGVYEQEGNHTIVVQPANCIENCIKRIYAKLNVSPVPICTPIPPLTFLVDTVTPIIVRIKVENG